MLVSIISSSIKTLVLFLCSLLLFSGCSTYIDQAKVDRKKVEQANKSFYRSLPKQAKPYAQGMQYIPGVKKPITAYSYPTPTEKDTTLYIKNYPRVNPDSISGFFMSDHEVTNAEYRLFVNRVRDSVVFSKMAETDSTLYLNTELKILNWQKWKGLNNYWPYTRDTTYKKAVQYFFKDDKSSWNPFDQLKVIYTYKNENQEEITTPVYPDTLVFIKEFSYAFNDPMAQSYFWHPGYNNYPVMGVSWQQANAYCHWRTGQINKAVAEHNKNRQFKQKITFRLPTEAEWEIAASAAAVISAYTGYQYSYIYPFGDGLSDEKGKYLANFGMIYDLNRITIKHSINDGGFYTLKVKSYSPNPYNIYDLAGNVAEWTSDTPGVNVTEFYTDMILKKLYYHTKQAENINNYNDSIVKLYDSVFYSIFPGALKWNKRKAQYVEGKKTLLQRKEALKKYGLDFDRSNNVIKHQPDLFADSLRSVYMPYVEPAIAKTIVEPEDNAASATEKINLRKELLLQAERQILADVEPSQLHKYDSLKNVQKASASKGLEYVYAPEGMAEEELHNVRVRAKNPNAKIVKGGSWANGPAYMQIGAREIFSEDKSSSRIGFRVVMVVE